MYGEFKIRIRKADRKDVLSALKKFFTNNNLSDSYNKSQFKNVIPESDFDLGFSDEKICLFIRISSEELKINIENIKNPSDISQLKNRMNEYHLNLIENLRDDKLYPKLGRQSSAIITLENIEIIGAWPNRYKDIIEELKKKREKIFIEIPIAFVVSFLALRYSLFNVQEYTDDVKKTIILLAEASLGTLVILLFNLFFYRIEKKFKFTL
ncbi:MAG TPA: hypothetical protein VN721_00715 [Flavipsychrobacter sp.]|nr:hypothetical protein [Flavipsychrobacter sp.]